MNTYKIAITTDFDNLILTGEFVGATERSAIAKCKDFYAIELDTVKSAIQILEVKQVSTKDLILKAQSIYLNPALSMEEIEKQCQPLIDQINADFRKKAKEFGNFRKPTKINKVQDLKNFKFVKGGEVNMNDYNFPVELQPIYTASEGKNTEITNRKAVVRQDNNNIIGFVSDDYALVKHAEVVNSFRKAGKSYNFTENIEMSANGAVMFYKMTFPDITIEAGKGDKMRLMLVAKNSYNGSSSLTMLMGAYRLVCSNGMIIGKSFYHFKIRHIGDLPQIGIADYKEGIERSIPLFIEQQKTVQAMANKTLSQDEGLFDAKALDLPEYLMEEAQEKYQAEKEQTVWGYYNALTYAITHKMKKQSPNQIVYGQRAWKAAQVLI